MIQLHRTSIMISLMVTLHLVATVHGLMCYQCNNVTSPSSCKSLATCSSGQICFTEESPGLSQTVFNLGCRSTNECFKHNQQSASTIIGRRSPSTRGTCRQCCGVDECNTHLCSWDTTQTVNSTECTDDPNYDCIRISGLYNLCADVQHARTVCRSFCGLCNVTDGNWSDWMAWSNCDVTCRQGQRSRSRTCTNPPPSNGGVDCSGNSTEIGVCNTGVNCPVHGEWSNWSPWGTCSVTCDAGMSRRDRTCSNPYPKFGGDYCPGDTRDDRLCTMKACADGGWSTWSNWDTCSATCGTGLTRRRRQCTNPTPSQFGKPCDGDNTDFNICSLTSCNVDGQWTHWSSWSSCSDTCGVGMRVRTRACTNPAPSHGRGCSGNNKDTEVCHNAKACFGTFKRNVVFLARAVSNTSPGVNTKLVFTRTVLDTDNSYNKSTGVFIAPVAGTYWFSAQICGYVRKFISFGICVNDVMMSTAIQYDPNDYTCISSSTVAVLSQGDNVYVKTGVTVSLGNTIYYDGSRWNMFMGSLVN